MKKLLLYFSTKCHFCNLAKLRLKQLVPSERVIMHNVDLKNQGYNKFSSLAGSNGGLPCMFIVKEIEGGKFAVGSTPEQGEYVHCEGYREPYFTDFVGTHLYGIENFYQKVQNKQLTKKQVYESLLKNDQLD